MTAPTDEHARNDFSQAKYWWRWLLGVQFALPIVAALSALLPFPAVTIATTFATLLLTALLFWFRRKADDCYERAESIRRIDLLHKGLGIAPDPTDVARLLAETTDQKSPDPAPKGSYYNSPLPAGPRRLAHAVWESAHFTGQQAKEVATLCGSAAILGVIGVLALFFFGLALAPQVIPASGSHTSWLIRNATGIAGAGAAMLSFFGLGTLAELWRNFRSLASVAELTCSRCEALVRDPALPVDRVIVVLESYNCAVARCAPLPSFVWRSMQVKLTASWDAISSKATK